MKFHVFHGYVFSPEPARKGMSEVQYKANVQQPTLESNFQVGNFGQIFRNLALLSFISREVSIWLLDIPCWLLDIRPFSQVEPFSDRLLPEGQEAISKRGVLAALLPSNLNLVNLVILSKKPEKLLALLALLVGNIHHGGPRFLSGNQEHQELILSIH